MRPFTQRLLPPTLAVLAMMALGCANGTTPDSIAPPGDVTLLGEVVEIDVSAMEVDGDGVIRLRLDGGAEAQVLIPSGESRCEAEGLLLLFELTSGDRIEARDHQQSPDAVRPCTADHYLRRAGSSP